MGRGNGSVISRNGNLYLSFRYKGRQEKPRLVGLVESNKQHVKRAEMLLQQINLDIYNGTIDFSKYFPNQPIAKRHRPPAANIKISEQLLSWLDASYKRVEKSTYRSYCSAVNSILIPAFGDLPLGELVASDIREWIKTQVKSNKTINNNLIPLRQIFKEAYQDGYIDNNPLDRVDYLPLRTPKVEPFSIEEKQAILAAAEGQVKNIIQFAFETGVRVSELVALPWEYVDLESQMAHIQVTRTREGEKNRAKTALSKRAIHLNEAAIEALLNQRAITGDSGSVFLNPRTNLPWLGDGPLRKTGWQPLLDKAGVRYRPLKTTRHTFASLALTAGEHPMWVAQQLGHKDWGMIRNVYGLWMGKHSLSSSSLRTQGEQA